VNVRTDEARKQIRLDAVPNRHAALHGIVPYSSFKSSLNAIFLIDSARQIPGWQWIEDYELPETIRRLSVGYLIAETEDAIALAPNLGDVEQPKAQACGIIGRWFRAMQAPC
jgi:hypothetical protein